MTVMWNRRFRRGQRNPVVVRRWVLAMAVAALVVLAAALRLEFAGSATLWANLFWLSAAAFAVALSWLTDSRLHTPNDRLVIALWRSSLVLYLVAQTVWALSVLAGQATVPGPADALFLCSALPSIAAFVLMARGRLSGPRLLASQFDLLLTLLALVVVLLVWVRPAAGSEWLDLVVQFGYPVLFLAPAGAGLVAAASVPLRPQLRGTYLLILGWMLLGIGFTAWTIRSISGLETLGSAADFAFGVGLLASGWGVATWRGTDADLYLPGALTRVLREGIPVTAVVAAIGSVILHPNASERSLLVLPLALVVLVATATRQLWLVRTGYFYERSFEHLVDHLPMVVWALDAKGRVRLWNRAAEYTSGFTAAEILGRELPEKLVPRESADALSDSDDGNRVSPSSPLYQIENRSGERRLLEWTEQRLQASRFSWEQLGFGLDVTQSTAERQRRLELERELVGSRRLESVGRLAGGIAHDFNNLLAIVSGSAQLLRQDVADLGEVPPEVSEGIEGMLAATSRGADLVKRLMEFSGTQPGKVAAHDVRTVLEELAPMMQRLIVEPIAMDFDLGENPCHVLADRVQLEQVILNLVINARDAMPQGGSLRVSTSRTLDRLGMEVVELQVRDTGVGMDAETLGRIFEPFFSTKTAAGGTGLGLATVYGLVSAWAGSVDVQSAVGAGTTVTVRLPVTSEPAPSASPAVAAEAGGERTAASTVLVVEDEAAIRDILERVCAELGHHVLTAADGEEGLMRSRGHRGPIDLLVTDVAMPKLGGVQMAKTLVQERPELKLLVISGYLSGDVKEGAGGAAIVRQGLDELATQTDVERLNKPFSLEAVRAAVARLVATRRPRVAGGTRAGAD